LSVDHIIADAWSGLNIVNFIIEDFYGELDIESIGSYEDYINENIKYLNSKSFNRSLDYWMEKINQIGPVDSIYSKNSLRYDSARDSFKVNKILTQKMQQYIKENKTSAYCLFMSALAVYINHITNMNDFYIGTSVLNRVNKKQKNTMGMFVNTIPLSFRFNEEMTFADIVSKTSLNIMGGFRHQRCNYGRILEELGDTKGLFDIILSLQNASIDEKYKNVEIEWIEPKKQINPLQIHLVDYSNSGQYDMIFDYQTDLFNKDKVENIFKHICNILEKGIENSDALVRDMELISEDEKNEILNIFNSPINNKFKNKTAVELFEETVEKCGDKTALIYEDRKIKYMELNERANMLATNLRKMGFKPNDIIALSAERNIETLIGLLAILKSGASYLPIDPEFPQERITYMLEDSKAKALLCSCENYTVPKNVKTISLIEEDNYAEEKGNLEIVNKPEDIAYIIYTSGTTGKPKGVMIEHKNLCNLKNIYNQFDLINKDVVLQFANLVFDASVWEIWMAFMNGLPLVLVNKDLLLDVKEFFNIYKKHNISVALLPPQYFLQLEDVNLRILFTGGSASSKEVLEKIDDKTTYYNVYGPTESTVISTYWKYDKKQVINSVPIGKPCANCKIYIMKDNKLCLKGIKGEICVAGYGVARGYLGREDLTNKSFIDNPFGEGKLYRTGDLGSWLPNGDIEYLGRIDEQVKVRGFRIELGEIESQIRNISKVNDTAVVAFKDSNGEYNIYAYIVSDEKLEKNYIISNLSKSLPYYMIPKFIVFTDEIPVNTSGKVDKKALSNIKIEDNKKYIEAKNEMEILLSNVFKEALNLEKISVTESFYEVGGDSIKAIRISSKINELGYELKVKDIFALKTIEALSKVIKKKQKSSSNQEEVTGEVIQTPIINEFFNWKLKNINHFNQGIMIHAESFKEQYIKSSLDAIVKHHDSLRMVYDKNKLNILSYKENKAYELITYDVTEFKEDELAEKIESICNEVNQKISLDKKGLVKAALIKTIKGDELFLCIHHIAVDGFSWRVILEDFINAYNMAEKDKKIVLPEKTASFKEWAEKLNTYKKNLSYDDDLSYWINTINEAKESMVPFENEEEGDRDLINFSIDSKITKNLIFNSNRVYGTKLNDLLLSALVKAINLKTGQNKLGIFLEGHGRRPLKDDINLDRTVGWFTSLFPVLFEKGDTLAECIYNVKETIRNVDGKELGFGLLKEKMPELHRNLCFNYLGDFSEILNGSVKFSKYSTGEFNAIENGSLFDISFDCFIKDNKIVGEVHFDNGKYSKEFMEDLVEKWMECLNEIAASNNEDRILTPSDFGNVFMDNKDFRVLSDKYEIDNVKALYSLTYLQEGMLYHKEMDEDATSYILQNIVKIKDTSIDVLEKAIDYIQARYDVLRTSFLYRKVKKPVQVVLKNRAIERRVLDYSGDNLRQYIDSIIDEDLERGFDLEEDSLLRMSIIKNKNVNYMIWNFHHIIIDGWCIGLLLDDFLKAVDIIKNGDELYIKEESIFGEYVDWLRRQPVKAGINYWKNLLKDYEEAAVIIPMNKSENKGVVKKRTLKISNDLKDKLLELSTKSNVTINTIFESTLGICLQKYNKNDVVFGKIVSGRNVDLNGIESAVGLFINTIPVRVKTEENMTCLQLLKSVQKQGVNSMEYDYCPLVEIQKASDLGQDLFNILLVFENYDTLNLDKYEGKMEAEYVREETSYDLTISVYLGDSIELEAMYYDSMYGDFEMDLLLSRMENLLKNITLNKDALVQDISLLSKEELNKVICDFNKTGTPYAIKKSVAEVFEEQVKKYSEKTAIEYLDKSITYGELNNAANNLAYQLRKMGLERNNFVAVFADRGIELIIGILGIIKAGGAYVPIDIRYPNERIQYILDDCKPKCIVTDSRERLKNFDTDIVEIESMERIEALEVKEELKIVNNPEDLLYMIYTSGTTGKPKGVMVEHHNLINMIYAYKDLYNIKDTDVIMQFASIAFDQSVWDIFSGILLGATLLMVPQEIIGDTFAIPKYANEHNVTVATLTPAFIKKLDPESFKTLRLLETGAAAAEIDVLNKWKGKVQIFNTYGPTETTVNAISYEYISDLGDNKTMPIGKPISNLEIFILKDMSICGVGIAGELCIAGEGVTRGYFNREDLTKEKFIPNPFGKGKLYRTGDLARWLIDGNIEYLGRIDEQVKIRGFRIELGEIESRLREYKNVVDAVVIAQDEKFGDKRLCAYIVSNEEINIGDVKTYLGSCLPKYMVPSAMVQIEKMPLTPNGKVNKKELPYIENLGGENYVAPRNELEESLEKIFCKVLEVKRAGIYDDFFDIGGHSLKAVRLVNEIEVALGVRLKLSEIFEKPVIAEIAKLIEKNNEKNYVDIPKAEEKPYYEMSSVQKRLYILNEMDKSSTVYNMPGILNVKGKFDVDKAIDAFKKIVLRHDALRTSFHIIDGEFYQKIDKNLDFKVEYLENLTKSEVENIKEKFVTPFDFSKAPLMKVKIIKEDKEDFTILFDMHHIISDGQSINVILKEFTALYKDISLEEIKIGYKDYSEWIKHKDYTSQKNYWKEVFADGFTPLDLPLDYKRPKIQSFRGDVVYSSIDINLIRKIKDFAKKTDTTEYMVFLAAYMVLLHKYSKQEDILIGTPVSGRLHKDTENMIGMFVNTLVMRGTLEKDMIFNDFLESIKAMCIKNFENQEYPFEELVEEFVKERDLSRNACFDVMMALEDSSSSEDLVMNDITISLEDKKHDISRFDITLNIIRTDKDYKVMAEYCTDLFEKETIKNLLNNFNMILSNIIKNPSEKISNITTLSEEEENLIINKFSKGENKFRDYKTIIEVFEEEVLKNPEKIAVIDHNEKLTYDEFNKRVN
ncbi:MAG: amino acid adenylation domain-containing protein, partial [Clostridium sp.]|nr:amino acid adenylation domain-containing protein [Clostridium sp.]